MNAVALSFKNTHFQITDINGQPWLRGLQIASALGYKNPTLDITNLYDRNADEFTNCTRLCIGRCAGAHRRRLIRLNAETARTCNLFLQVRAVAYSAR